MRKGQTVYFLYEWSGLSNVEFENNVNKSLFKHKNENIYCNSCIINIIYNK